MGNTYEQARKETLALQVLILKIKELIDEHLKEGCKGHQKGDAIKDG